MFIKYTIKFFIKKKIFNFILRFFCIIYICDFFYTQNSNDFVFASDQKNISSSQFSTVQIEPSTFNVLDNNVIYIISDRNNDAFIVTSIPVLETKSVYFTDTADYLKKIPGFSMIRNGGVNNDLIFRGMHGSKIRVLIDNSEIIGVCCDRMDPASSYINMESFDILNIIKGPQTVLYGPTVSGGVLQFQRHHPYFYQSNIKLHSDVTCGSNNSINRNIDSTVGNKYGYIRLISNLSYSDDYYDGHNNRVHSSWYKWNTDAILFFIFKDLNTQMEINLGQGNGRASYPDRYMDGLCLAKESYSLKIKTIDVNKLLSKVEFQTWHHNIHHLMACNRLYTNLTKEKEESVVNNQHCCSNRVMYDLDRFLWGIRSIATCEWNNIQCCSGLDAQINYHRKNRKYDNDHSINILVKDIGIFSECTLDLLSNQRLIGGIRVEYTTTHINKYCGLFGKNQVVYPTGFIRYEKDICSLSSYYMGIGTSQRFPDYWELISNTSCIENIKKMNQIFQLKPEKTIQIDTGICFKKSKMDGWISSYVGYIRNYISNDDLDIMRNNIVNYSNGLYAQIYGSEIGFNYKFNDYWYGKSNIAWTWGINVDNRYVMSTISPLEGMLICQFKKNNVHLEGSWRLVSPALRYVKKNSPFMLSVFDSDNNMNISGFGVFSVYATWKDAAKYITYSAGINNLFNQSYTEYVHGKFNFNEPEKLKEDFIYEPGRIWWIKVSVSL